MNACENQQYNEIGSITFKSHLHQIFHFRLALLRLCHTSRKVISLSTSVYSELLIDIGYCCRQVPDLAKRGNVCYERVSKDLDSINVLLSYQVDCRQ